MCHDFDQVFVEDTVEGHFNVVGHEHWSNRARAFGLFVGFAFDVKPVLSLSDGCHNGVDCR